MLHLDTRETLDEKGLLRWPCNVEILSNLQVGVCWCVCLCVHLTLTLQAVKNTCACGSLIK